MASPHYCMDYSGRDPVKEDGERDSHGLPGFIDWLLGAIVIVGGFGLVVAGMTLLVGIDRNALVETIEAEAIETTVLMTELTEAEIAGLADAAVVSSAIGLVVTGVAVIGFGIGFSLYRYWIRRRTRTGVEGSSFATYAMLGAIVSIAVSFIPFSTVIGGGVAGYLEGRESKRTVSVGGLAGFLPTLPVALFTIVFLIGMLFEIRAIDGQNFAILVTGTTLLAILILLTLAAGFGALGGYLGGKIAESDEQK